jgi:hypothetical protein
MQTDMNISGGWNFGRFFRGEFKKEIISYLRACLVRRIAFDAMNE